MKNIRICLLIIVLLAVSCAKSRFATTTRHYHDGKVAYTNHYSNEKMNLSRHKTKHPPAPARDASAKTPVNLADDPDAINKMDLIASTDKNFLVLGHVEKLISRYAARLYPEYYHEKEVARSENPRDPPAKDLAGVSLKELTRRDTTVVKKGDGIKDHAAGSGKRDHRKIENLGLAGFILSFFGLIPLIGIPFAILAIIFGAVSINRISRNPEKYKGKGFAMASILIGSAVILISIIVLIAASSAPSSTPQVNSSSTTTTC